MLLQLFASCFPSQWANASNGNRSMATAFAPQWTALVVQLVQHLQGNLKPGTDLWLEATNEWDLSGYDAAALGQLVAQIAVAAKGVWPQIKVGGPAKKDWRAGQCTRRPLGAELIPFLKFAGGAVDFLSYHAYCTGSTGGQQAGQARPSGRPITCGGC